MVAYVQRRLNLRHSLQSIAEGLVAEAMHPQRCAHDNITVLVVQFAESVRAAEAAAGAGLEPEVEV